MHYTNDPLRAGDGGSTSASSSATPQAADTAASSPGTTPSSTAGSTGTAAQPTQTPNILSESTCLYDLLVQNS